jgi:hypothetical protein
MVLTPTGNLGNYYSAQERDSGRIEWLETFSRALASGGSTHNLKFGSTVARTSNAGQLWERPIDILDAAGHRLKQISFVGGGPYRKTDIEQGFFAQDHWLLAPNLAVDVGTRLEYQGITGTLRFAPRTGVAWTPFHNQRTVVRGGFGIFYDRVPLSVYSFGYYPEQVITTYGLNGQIVGEPRRFLNITEIDLGKRFPLIDSRKTAGNFAPFSKTWNIEIEHPLSRLLRLRANYSYPARCPRERCVGAGKRRQVQLPAVGING